MAMSKDWAIKILIDEGFIPFKTDRYQKDTNGRIWIATIHWGWATGWYIEMAECHFLKGDSTPYLNTGIYKYIYSTNEAETLFKQLKNLGKYDA